jgi:hypothetical protein
MKNLRATAGSNLARRPQKIRQNRQEQISDKNQTQIQHENQVAESGIRVEQKTQ